MARTHDMDRKHMMEMFRRAHDHKGAAFVEIYQNCNVFNDGAFEAITGKDNRADMLIPLRARRADPLRRRRRARACVLDGQRPAPRSSTSPTWARTQHPRARRGTRRPGLAFLLSRLPHGPTEPTPIGVFRAVDRPDYGTQVNQQLAATQAAEGPGHLDQLLHSAAHLDGRLAAEPGRPGGAQPSGGVASASTRYSARCASARIFRAASC